MGEEAAPIGLDPIPGQNTSFTSLDLGILTSAVYTVAPSFSLRSWGVGRTEKREQFHRSIPLVSKRGDGEGGRD